MITEKLNPKAKKKLLLKIKLLFNSTSTTHQADVSIKNREQKWTELQKKKEGKYSPSLLEIGTYLFQQLIDELLTRADSETTAGDMQDKSEVSYYAPKDGSTRGMRGLCPKNTRATLTGLCLAKSEIIRALKEKNTVMDYNSLSKMEIHDTNQ